MKPRMKAVDTTEEKTKPAAKKAPAKREEPAEPEPKPRGGARAGSGRPAYLQPHERKKKALYMSATDEEKAIVLSKAEKEGLTISYYLRKRCGLPIAV